MNFVTRGVRDAFRNSTRTLSIVMILGLSIGLSLAMLIANRAVNQKITSVKSSIGNTITVSPAGVRGFEGGGEPLTTAQLDGVKTLSHVTKIDESVSARLTSSDTALQSAVDAGSLGRRFQQSENGSVTDGADGAAQMRNMNFTPPITVTGATDTATAVGGTSVKFTSGANIDGAVDANVAVIGAGLATKNNLSVGSTFQAYGADVTVKGIFDAGNTFANNQIVFALPTLQRLSTQTGDISSATVTVDSINNIDSVVTAIKSKLGDKADVTNSKDTAASAVAPLESIKSVSMFSLVGAAVAGGTIILLTMIMIVRERKREIGVIKAIGGSNLHIMSQFMVESLTLALLGAFIGVFIGAIGANPITKMLVSNAQSDTTTSVGGPGQMSGARPQGMGGGGMAHRLGQNSAVASIKNINATVGWDVLAYDLGAVVLISVIGSAAAAGLISKVRPSQVMRTE